LGFGVVVLLSTKMLTYGSSTGRADGAWGSTDFGAYWIVADYLQQHGADVASYEAQSTYRASDIDEHLHLHARLGGMTTIAVLAHAIMPGRVAAMINPLIVASLFLLVAVVECFARRERLWPSTGLLASAFHPFLYFLLFYTYLGQAFSVLLIASGVFVAEASDRQAGDGTWHRGAIGAGLFFAAAILQYASAFLVPGIFLASFFLFRRRRGAMMSALICGGTILVVAGYHLPRSIRELTAIRSLKVMPGWEWHRLVNVQELLGLRSLIHYEPQHSDLVASLVTFAITALVAFALCVHLRRGALPRSAAAMIISTCALAAYACLKYWQHVPNATHGLAKVVSQYAIFILLFAAAGVVAFFPTRHRRAQNCLQLALGVFVVIQFLQVVNWRRAPWFDYDLITLATRHESAEKIIFDDDVDDRLFMPLMKNIGRLATDERTGPRLRFTLESRRDRFPDAALVDREGAYVALRENKIVGRASR
jgi:MFS family permease